MRNTTRKLAQPTSRALTLAYLMDLLIGKMEEATMRLQGLKPEAVRRAQLPLLQGKAMRCRAVLALWAYGLIVVGMVGLQTAHAQGIQYSFKIPSQPSFLQPESVALAPDGSIWVTDTLNNQIVKFDPANPGVELRIGSLGAGAGQFNNPTGVATDSSGNVYVVDRLNHRIQKFMSNGSFLRMWGSLGSVNGRFNVPYGVAVDSLGNVYVSDAGNFRIQKFTSDGVFLTKWGSVGSGDGQFGGQFIGSLLGVAVDASGNVFTADFSPGIDRIQKFTSDGVFVTKWGTHGGLAGQFIEPRGVAVDSSGSVYVTDFTDRVQKFDGAGGFVTSWGSRGRADGQLLFPTGLAADSSGNVYVADGSNNRVQKFTSGGGFLSKWGSFGSDDGQFNVPSDVSVDGNVYVSEAGNGRIQVFTSTGNFLTKWGFSGIGGALCSASISSGIVSVAAAGSDVYIVAPPRIQRCTSEGVLLAQWGSLGSADGAGSPSGLAVGPSGVYVADRANHRIQIFTNQGAFAGKWGSLGSADGQFNDPIDVAVDSSGNVYVVERNNRRVQKFTSTGAFVTKWGSTGTGDGQFGTCLNFIGPQGVAVDSSGDVYVADTCNNRIQKFTSDGAFLTKSFFGNGDGQLNRPQGLAVDLSGNVYVADSRNNRVQVFNQANTPIGMNVVVQPGGSGLATLTFDHVTQAGNTTLTTSSTGPAPPAGLTPGTPATYYDLATTALFSGAVGVCLNYSGVSFGNESQIKQYHYENNAWVDTTVSLDTTSNIICGTVTSLSPFAIFETTNQPPLANAGGPYSVEEGGAIALAGSGSDLDGDPLTYSWDLDNDANFETAGQTPPFSAAGRDGPSSQAVVLRVCDIQNACATSTATVSITNAQPAVGPINGPTSPVQANTSIDLSSGFADAGILDTHTALWNWGDGTTSDGVVTEANGVGTVAGSHSYTAAGVYSVTLTVTDKDGSSGEAIFQLVVIYNKIAFSSTRDGNLEIYSMNIDGTGVTRLTTNPAVDAFPVWSPNSAKIAFTSNRTAFFNFEVYVMNSDGSGVTRLTTNAGADGGAAWSPDGTKIAFTSKRHGNPEIYVMNADGSGQTRLTNNWSADFDPTWSPDGTRIAFVTNRDGNFEIYSMNADGTAATRLTTHAAIETFPAWSPDGTKIAFTSNRDGFFNSEIYVMNADGSVPTRLTTNPGLDVEPAWSMDGARILFSTNRDGILNFEIYAMNADGSGQTRLTNKSSIDTSPDW